MMISLKNTFDWSRVSSAHRLMFTIILAMGLLNFFWGEKVLAGGGFGWDGVNYANMVLYLNSMISDGQLSHYYAQRILPSLMVRIVMLAIDLPMTDANIIKVFEIYNLTLLLFSCYLWKKVADTFNLSLTGRWIGFSGLFINFESSKQAFYYPVLTDVTALFIAMLLLLFYVRKNSAALFVSATIGSFCWPVVGISGAFLLFFLRSELPNSVIKPAPQNFLIKYFKVLYRIEVILVLLAVLGFVGVLLALPISQGFCESSNIKINELLNLFHYQPSWLIGKNYSCVYEKLLIKSTQFLTGLPSVFALFIASVILLGSSSFLREFFLSICRAPRLQILFAILVLLIPAWAISMLSNPQLTNAGSAWALLMGILFPREGKVFLPVITLTSFWGPLVLLVILKWHYFCIEVRRLGIGAVLVIGLSLVLGLVCEPRFFTIGWPFITLGVVLALERLKVKSSFKYVLFALTILFAQFWMKLNVGVWVLPDGEWLEEYPKQLMYMHYGLWMGWWAYIGQLIVFAASYWFLRNTFIKPGLVTKR